MGVTLQTAPMAPASPNPKVPPAKAPSPGKPPAASRPKAAKVSSFLTEDLILVPAKQADKGALLEALVRLVCDKKGISEVGTVLANVQEREQGISTTLDTGLSLPHVRLDNLGQIVAALALIPQGIPDPKQADLTIRAMFLFFSPNKPEFFPQHLQVLRAVSSLFQPDAIDRLTAAPSPAAALELLKKLET